MPPVRFTCDVVVLEDEEVAVKSGYPRFMLEETHEPPRSLAKSALPGGIEGQLAERRAAYLGGPSA